MALRGAVIGSVVALACAVAPAAAPAARTSVALFSDPDSFVGYGVQRLFTPDNSEIVVQQKYGILRIDVNPGTLNTYSLEFATPRGTAARGPALQRGVYDYAQLAEARYGDRPGINVFGQGRACNAATGRFEVRDIARRRSGAIKRLWIVYELHCGRGAPGIFGEVRIHEGHRLALPAVVRWSAGEHGSVGATVPVTFAPSSRAVTFRRARLAGRDSEAFRIRSNHCSGKTIKPGRSCRIWVRFQAGPGTHRAKLRVAATSGRTYGSKLQGFNWGGRTHLVMHSEKGDYIGQGLDWLYTPLDTRFNRGATRNRVGFDIRPPDTHWAGSFRAPAGDPLVVGVFRNAVRYAPPSDQPGLDVGGDGRGCNTLTGRFRVTQIRFNPRDGALRNFAARFVQHCEGAKPALRGELAFRAGDRTKPAPWMEPPGS